jgi:hypothetical protein
MTPRLRFSGAALAMLIACVSFGAGASPVVYFGQDPGANGSFVVGGNSQQQQTAFLGALQPGYVSEGFSPNSFTQGQTASPTALSILGGHGTIAATAGDTAAEITGQNCDDQGCTGRFDTTAPGAPPGASYWWEASQSFTVMFGSSASAFGFYGTDLSDFGGSLSLQLLNASGAQVGSSLVISPAGGGAQNGGLLFYGFTDSQQSYSGVRFVLTQQPGATSIDVGGFDDLVVGNVPSQTSIPEPTTLALVSLALVGAAASRRRRGA